MSKKFSFQLALEGSQWRRRRYSRRQAVSDSWRCGSEGTVADGRAACSRNDKRIGHRWPQVPTWLNKSLLCCTKKAVG